MKITKKQLGALLGERIEDNKLFSVKFKKKDGKIRDMLCRCNVLKNTTGGEWSWGKDPTDYNLMLVFDMDIEDDQGFRCFKVDSVLEISTEGQKYLVE